MDYGLKPLGKEKLFLWLMLTPTVIGLLFGTIGSLVATLTLSFFDWDLIGSPTWAGISNYLALFENENYINAFLNTLKFSALYVPGVVVISLVACRIVESKNSRRGDFPYHLFFADSYVRNCHRAGVEYDLRQGSGILSSYGKATKSSGEVKLVKDLDQGLEGRDLLVVEDIVDTGLTLNYLVNLLKARGPRSLKVVALLSKPARRLVSVHVDYVGFTIEDEFVVGYGLDYNERYRNLRDIVVYGG